MSASPVPPDGLVDSAAAAAAAGVDVPTIYRWRTTRLLTPARCLPNPRGGRDIPLYDVDEVCRVAAEEATRRRARAR